MKTDIRFFNEVARIVNGALRLDVDKVRNYTAFLADKLESAGEQSAAGSHPAKTVVTCETMRNSGPHATHNNRIRRGVRG